ncbi:MAG: inositol 2-dehydrogenase [Chloroflexi bacterium RBG_19FT_COMBO_47_9]|nr:MAG: inositol 2-dehydrogenase [Chloroflexi bacterium RBG_16_47_49]OGO66053.1 MAG: inositol 2-dehydrogenase [Chloroflexi bacterium RBG_19FT_COMBO_47_9]
MKRQVNIAVIGTGRIGSVHTRDLVRSIHEANVVAICDIRLEVAQAVADELGIERVVKDYHEVLEDKNIEAVLIATNTDTHAFIVKDAANAGKQIFCEKPLALDLESSDEVLDTIEKTKVKLQVGFNRRFDRSFRRVREIVTSGDIGNPCILHLINRDPEPPSLEYARTSGGMFLDMSIHDFDMARFQIGEIEEVYAIGNVLVAPYLKEIGDVDTNIITLRFANGAVGTIDNSRQCVYGYDQRLEVFCSNGTAMAGNEYENTVVKGNGDGYHSAKLPYFFIQRYADGYINEVRQFIQCVRDDKPVSPTGQDSRMAVLLGMATWESFRQNRPISMKEFIG